jgi:hypothetical protein
MFYAFFHGRVSPQYKWFRGYTYNFGWFGRTLPQKCWGPDTKGFAFIYLLPLGLPL